MAGFQLKDFVSITAAALNQAKATQEKITDFEIGSVARTLIEAPAIEVEELYQKIFAGILDAIPTAIYKAFDFELIEKAAASGAVHLAFAGPIVDPFTIPAGTVFDSTSTSLKFTSTADVLVPVGAIAATVIVVCATAGTIGNVDAGAVTGTPGFTMPIGTVIRNDAFASGVDAQTEAERKARFVEFMLSLSRGTVPALRYAVKQAKISSAAGALLEYVTRIGIEESPGYVKMYIYGSAGIASTDLVAKAQQLVDGYRDTGGVPVPGYRAGGTPVVVMAMAERLIPVELRIKPLYGIDLTDNAKEILTNKIATALAPEFEGVDAGDVLLVEQITDAALTVPGVQRALSSNSTNELCAEYEVLRLGPLTVDWDKNA